MRINLEPYEVELGTFIGNKRYEEAILQNKKDSHGFKKSPEEARQIHIDGACGEIAFAKSMNWFYSGSVNTYKEGGDVGEIQVRTRSQHDYDLIIRKNDRDSSVFVLVTGKIPEYIVHGWILAKDAKRQEFVKNYGGRPPAYFIPKKALNSLGSLFKQTAIKNFNERFVLQTS
jgi:hypothetical protein